MKKIIYRIIYLSLLGIGGVSCQKEGMTEPVSSREAIEFSARTIGTKGQLPLTHLDNLAAQDFSISAWYTKDGETFGTQSKAYLINHRFGTMDNQTSDETVWQGIARNPENNEKSPDPVYYPLGGTLSFFSFAPYRELSETSDIRLVPNPEETVTEQLSGYQPGSPLIIFTPAESAAKQIDFVAAAPVLDRKKEDGVVPLDFTRHLTTNIQFYCKYQGSVNTGEEKVLIKSIWIHNVIGSEYLYFTKNGEDLGYQWSSTVSPEGNDSMPLKSYSLTIDNLELTNNAYLSSTDSTLVNSQVTGRMYLLPQDIPDDKSSVFDEDSDPYLQITYQVLNGQNEIVDENILVYDLRGTKDWPLGQTVAYHVTINVAQRKVLNITARILDWEDAGNTHEPTELMY